jgi:hypothetical protein
VTVLLLLLHVDVTSQTTPSVQSLPTNTLNMPVDSYKDSTAVARQQWLQLLLRRYYQQQQDPCAKY